MPYPLDLIRRLAESHGFCDEPVLLPDGGMVNEAWRIGDAIMRIVRPDNHPKCDVEAEREALVLPFLQTAGVRTPALLALGGSVQNLAPGGEPGPAGLPETRPYTIYEFVEGDLLGYLPGEPSRYQRAFVELGAELAKVHRIALPEEIKPRLRDEKDDPIGQIDKAVAAGKLTGPEAGEIAAWVEQLSPFMSVEAAPALIHNDIHPWNLMVRDDRRLPNGDCGDAIETSHSKLQTGLAAIIDWGDASAGDPAVDFSMMPLQAVPPMLEGYREAGGIVDPGFGARALFHGMKTWLWEIVNLDLSNFDRQWWRMPPGGWDEMKSLLRELFPSAAPGH